MTEQVRGGAVTAADPNDSSCWHLQEGGLVSSLWAAPHYMLSLDHPPQAWLLTYAQITHPASAAGLLELLSVSPRSSLPWETHQG